MNYIFIIGGVMSSIGKGMIASSIGCILKNKEYSLRLRKIEPYLNVDSGTLNPFEHGEVFITDDGLETDLDIGNYERFADINILSSDIITSGKIYQELIQNERQGKMLGQTVQVIPHVTDLIKKYIHNHNQEDFIIYEIGGTIGDLESLHFLKAISDIQYDHKCIFIHVGYIPYISSSKEYKTKPIQHSIAQLRQMGINTDIVICRSENIIPDTCIEKIYRNCNVKNIFSIPDVKNLYRLPLHFDNIVSKIEEMCLLPVHKSDLSIWHDIAYRYEKRKDRRLRICIANKYSQNADAYKSLIEACCHASIEIDSTIEIVEHMDNIDGLIVPGGFGSRETETMISYIQKARENNIPFLGICLGMHLAIIEYCRNILNIKYASSEEFGYGEYVIKKYALDDNLGGTMRLGSKKCIINKQSKLYNIYNEEYIYERHRHRYDLSKEIFNRLDKDANMMISSISDDKITEAIELRNHRFFIAVQYHPETISRPMRPHKLFVEFLKSISYSDEKNQ